MEAVTGWTPQEVVIEYFKADRAFVRVRLPGRHGGNLGCIQSHYEVRVQGAGPGRDPNHVGRVSDVRIPTSRNIVKERSQGALSHRPVGLGYVEVAT